MSKPAWAVEHHSVVVTTQALARERPAWSAVTAEEQTAGRGQAERSFCVEPGRALSHGGVAVRRRSAGVARVFALAVGWAVRATLRHAGVAEVRLRWPNDLMVGPRKVGGILVEQGGAHTLLVGLGLNVCNQPWQADPALREIAGRLADAAGGAALPDRTVLAAQLLRAIGLAHFAFARRQLAGFVPILNRCWGESRAVVIQPAPAAPLAESRGLFLGIDQQGGVRLRLATGTEVSIPAHHVGRLIEHRG